MVAPCRTSNTVLDLGNANIPTVPYTLVPFYVIGNEAGWFSQIQVGSTVVGLQQRRRQHTFIATCYHGDMLGDVTMPYKKCDGGCDVARLSRHGVSHYAALLGPVSHMQLLPIACDQLAWNCSIFHEVNQLD